MAIEQGVYPESGNIITERILDMQFQNRQKQLILVLFSLVLLIITGCGADEDDSQSDINPELEKQIESLILQLDNADSFITAKAAEKLTKIGKPAVPDLIKVLNLLNQNKRIPVVIEILKEIGTSEALQAVKAFEEKNAPKVRLVATVPGDDGAIRPNGGILRLFFGKISPSVVTVNGTSAIRDGARTTLWSWKAQGLPFTHGHRVALNVVWDNGKGSKVVRVEIDTEPPKITGTFPKDGSKDVNPNIQRPSKDYIYY